MEEFERKMAFCDEIKRRYIRLSRGQRKVAQFVIDNPNVVATHIASEVGKMIGVSESTVIRFCYVMDLSGYSELQEKIKNDLSESKGLPTNKESLLLVKKKEYLFSKIMNRDVSSILNTIEYINVENYQRATEYLHRADTIYTLGFRQSRASAHYLGALLEYHGKRVENIEYEVQHIVTQIKNMNNNSLLFIIALDSILEDILTIAKIAKKKQVNIIAITNTSISPVRDYADVCFIAGDRKQLSLEAINAANSLTHALIEGMTLHNRKQYLDTLKTNTTVDPKLKVLEEVISN